MTKRGKLIFFGLAALASACTAILGVDDVPATTVASDGGPSREGSAVAPDDGGALESAIRAYSAAFCTRYFACYPKLVTALYQNVDDCTQQVEANHVSVALLPGFTSTVADFDDCVTRTTSIACAAFASADAKYACLLKGAKQVGDLCVDGAQCASGFCATDSETCRGCVEAPVANSPCTKNNLCGPGLTCNASTICVPDVGVGGKCSDDAPCAVGLGCSDGVCTTPPSAFGAACDGGLGCDLLQGVICDTLAEDPFCAPTQHSAVGGPCNVLVNDGKTVTLCVRNAACDTTTDTCPPVPNVGDACNDGLPCPHGYACINGTCADPLPSSFCQ